MEHLKGAREVHGHGREVREATCWQATARGVDEEVEDLGLPDADRRSRKPPPPRLVSPGSATAAAKPPASAASTALPPARSTAMAASAVWGSPAATAAWRVVPGPLPVTPGSVVMWLGVKIVTRAAQYSLTNPYGSRSRSTLPKFQWSCAVGLPWGRPDGARDSSAVNGRKGTMDNAQQLARTGALAAWVNAGLGLVLTLLIDVADESVPVALVPALIWCALGFAFVGVLTWLARKASRLDVAIGNRRLAHALITTEMLWVAGLVALTGGLRSPVWVLFVTVAVFVADVVERKGLATFTLLALAMLFAATLASGTLSVQVTPWLLAAAAIIPLTVGFDEMLKSGIHESHNSRLQRSVESSRSHWDRPQTAISRCYPRSRRKRRRTSLTVGQHRGDARLSTDAR